MTARNGRAKPNVTLERWLQALAQRTRETYRTWLERFERWCAETGADPGAVASVAGYVQHLVGKGYGVSAVRQAVSALRLKFRSRGVELEDPELALLLRTVRRTLGTAPRRAKRPFTLEMLERVQWRPGFAGIRDRAHAPCGLLRGAADTGARGAQYRGRHRARKGLHHHDLALQDGPRGTGALCGYSPGRSARSCRGTEGVA
jgi:hypothetical protein